MTKRGHRPSVFWILTLLIVIGGALAAWFHFRGKEGKEFREAKVISGGISATVLTTGTVQPRNRLEIKPPISGRAEKVLVKEGQTVKKGQILAWISSTERAALIDAARSKGPEELKRWEELYRPAPVIAPISGMVILRNVEPGQTFTTTDAIAVLSDRLVVKAQVDETDIAQIKLKMPAIIVLDAYPQEQIKAHVDQVAFDATTVNNITLYTVDVLPEQVPAFMRSGMTANVTFSVESKEKTLLVPSSAIRIRDGKTVVLLPRSAERRASSEKEVVLGLSDGKHAEVISGLKEGDVVLEPQFQSTDGQASPSNPFAPAGRRRRPNGAH